METKTGATFNRIIRFYMANGNTTISDLSAELQMSAPTTAKLVSEMCDKGYINVVGKLETSEGRRPNLYGLNPKSAYFVGVDVVQDWVNIGMMDFRGDFTELDMYVPISTDNSPETIAQLAQIITEFVQKAGVSMESVRSVNLNISGRVNPRKGYSYTWLNFSEEALSSALTRQTGLPTFIDNDSRAMAYGEYLTGKSDRGKNFLYINFSWGLGMGMVTEGMLYTGHSGFSGEIGHMHVFDNEVLCRCGKKGCLETGVSGQAFVRMVTERLAAGEASCLQDEFQKNGRVTIDQVVEPRSMRMCSAPRW